MHAESQNSLSSLIISHPYIRACQINSYISPAAVFRRPQLPEPETLTADNKLLEAEMLLRSHLPCSIPAPAATSSLVPPSAWLYCGAAVPAGSVHEVQDAAEFLIKHPVLQRLFPPSTADSPDCEFDRRALAYVYNEDVVGRPSMGWVR